MDSKALFKIGYGLYLLTAQEEGKDNGCIVNTLMQITSDPLLLLLGVNKQNYTHDMILHTGLFNLSVLSTEAPFSLFERFGFHSGRDGDKFQGFTDVERGENGLYYIKGPVNAYFSCQVLQSMDFGSHTLFKAGVRDMQVLSEAPSVSYAYYHANIKPKPQAPKKTGWRCEICGYVYEGEELPKDFICPICKHGASDFVKIEV